MAKYPLLRILICLILLLLSCFCVLAPSSASSLNVLHNFTGGVDGGQSFSSLVQAKSGLIYGETFGGGKYGYGTIFCINQGAFKTLYSFSGKDGSGPTYGLIQASDKFIYGTTGGGGAYGAGTIFRFSEQGTFTLLYSFHGSDGAGPHGLLDGGGGVLYGLTSAGGPSYNPANSNYGLGVAYSFVPYGHIKVQVLHAFTGLDGSYPQGVLVHDENGNFYGVTNEGGEGNQGTVFRGSKTGDFKTIHSFQGADGQYPDSGVVIGRDGNLYGTTFYGGATQGGTVFRLTPSGTLTTLHNFNYNDGNGSNPQGVLLQASDGNFYGTTLTAGISPNDTIFQITPAGQFTKLFSFDTATGYGSAAGLLQTQDGAFYGTTQNGGTFYNPPTTFGYGTVFRLDVTP